MAMPISSLKVNGSMSILAYYRKRLHCSPRVRSFLQSSADDADKKRAPELTGAPRFRLVGKELELVTYRKLHFTRSACGRSNLAERAGSKVSIRQTEAVVVERIVGLPPNLQPVIL